MKKLFFTTLFTIIAVISSAQVDNVKLQQEFVKELNAYRASKGLSSVQLDNNDNNKAKCQVMYCISINTLTHDYPDFKAVYAECGSFLSNKPNANYCLSRWINSPAHNRLLLLPNIDTVGIFCSEGVNINKNGYFVFLVLN